MVLKRGIPKGLTECPEEEAGMRGGRWGQGVSRLRQGAAGAQGKCRTKKAHDFGVRFTLTMM